MPETSVFATDPPGRTAPGRSPETGLRRDTNELHWEVVENGLDYLSRAVREAAGRDEDLKYAVLHLYAAIETIVKARLAREHWALTVSDLKTAKHAKYLAGDFVSAGAPDVLTRLRDIAGVAVKEEHLQAVRGVATYVTEQRTSRSARSRLPPSARHSAPACTSSSGSSRQSSDRAPQNGRRRPLTACWSRSLSRSGRSMLSSGPVWPLCSRS